MLGATHALTGLAGGAVTLPVAMVLPYGLAVPDHPIQKLAWVVACGGFALLADLDQPGSTISRMWGPVTYVLSKIVGFVFRGHRNGTHDFILGPVLLGGLIFWATLGPLGKVLILALAIGLGMRAVGALKPGPESWDPWQINLGLSLALAITFTTRGGQPPPFLPAAAVVGVLAHIAFDAPTEGGIPIPFTWLRPKGAIRLRPPKWLAPKAGNRWVNAAVSLAAVLTTAWLAGPWAGPVLASLMS